MTAALTTESVLHAIGSGSSNAKAWNQVANGRGAPVSEKAAFAEVFSGQHAAIETQISGAGGSLRNSSDEGTVESGPAFDSSVQESISSQELGSAPGKSLLCAADSDMETDSGSVPGRTSPGTSFDAGHLTVLSANSFAVGGQFDLQQSIAGRTLAGQPWMSNSGAGIGSNAANQAGVRSGLISVGLAMRAPEVGASAFAVSEGSKATPFAGSHRTNGASRSAPAWELRSSQKKNGEHRFALSSVTAGNEVIQTLPVDSTHSVAVTSSQASPNAIFTSEASQLQSEGKPAFSQGISSEPEARPKAIQPAFFFERVTSSGDSSEQAQLRIGTAQKIQITAAQAKQSVQNASADSMAMGQASTPALAGVSGQSLAQSPVQDLVQGSRESSVRAVEGVRNRLSATLSSTYGTSTKINQQGLQSGITVNLSQAANALDGVRQLPGVLWAQAIGGPRDSLPPPFAAISPVSAQVTTAVVSNSGWIPSNKAASPGGPKNSASLNSRSSSESDLSSGQFIPADWSSRSAIQATHSYNLEDHASILSPGQTITGNLERRTTLQLEDPATTGAESSNGLIAGSEGSETQVVGLSIQPRAVASQEKLIIGGSGRLRSHDTTFRAPSDGAARSAVEVRSDTHPAQSETTGWEISAAQSGTAKSAAPTGFDSGLVSPRSASGNQNSGQNPFQSMDIAVSGSGVLAGAARSLQASSSGVQLQIGYQDPVLGYVELKAHSAGGAVHAELGVQSEISGQTLLSHLGSLAGWMHDRNTPAESLSVRQLQSSFSSSSDPTPTNGRDAGSAFGREGSGADSGGQASYQRAPAEGGSTLPIVSRLRSDGTNSISASSAIGVERGTGPSREEMDASGQGRISLVA